MVEHSSSASPRGCAQPMTCSGSTVPVGGRHIRASSWSMEDTAVAVAGKIGEHHPNQDALARSARRALAAALGTHAMDDPASAARQLTEWVGGPGTSRERLVEQLEQLVPNDGWTFDRKQVTNGPPTTAPLLSAPTRATPPAS